MAYGVLTEQGDLGLGFNEATTEEEAEIIKENIEKQESSSEEK